MKSRKHYEYWYLYKWKFKKLFGINITDFNCPNFSTKHLHLILFNKRITWKI